jgi:RNA polymerase sigma factor for flagellar operon FliA
VIEHDLKADLTEASAEEFRPLVQYIARKIHSRLPEFVRLDDLVQFGMLGLLDAINKFDPDRDNKFKTYAEFRIRGAIFDGLRKTDLVPRSAREVQKAIELAVKSAEVELGRKPAADEIAGQMGISVNEYHKLESHNQSRAFIPIHNEDLFTANDRRALLVSINNKDSTLVDKIDAMQKLEQIVWGAAPIDRACFILFYVWGFQLNEIAELFNCTESRISQRIKAVHFYGDRNARR